MIFDGEFSYDIGLERARDIIDTKATAVFCFNDVMAHGFARGAKDANYRVPEDISVLGYDDIIFMNYGPYIKLSTVKQPVREMGRYLAETMIAEVEGKSVELRKIFPAVISEKETTCSV
ncbi:MAG: substrate-binding domain-containing protein [Eisenbergiella sp.]